MPSLSKRPLIVAATFALEVCFQSGVIIAAGAEGSPQRSLAGEPVSHASRLMTTNETQTTLTLQWTRGSGDAVIVVARSGSSPIDPVDGVAYAASPVLGAGDETGAGSSVLYNGPGDTVHVTALSPNQRYYLQVFEYGDDAGGPNYLTSGAPEISTRTTAIEPLVGATDSGWKRVTGGSARLTWVRGDGDRVLIVVKALAPVSWRPEDRYLPAPDPWFQTSPDVGGGHRIVYAGAGSFVDLRGLRPATCYHWAAFEYKGIGDGSANYLLDPYLSGVVTTRHTVARWDFPGDPDDPVVDFASLPNAGRCVGTEGGTAPVECSYDGVATRSARASGWQEGSGVKAWRIDFSSEGFKNLTVFSRMRSSAAGPRDFRVQYRPAGQGAWTDALTGMVCSGNDEWTTGTLDDLKLPEGCNGKGTVEVRWLMVSNTRADGQPVVMEDGACNIDDIVVVADEDYRGTVIRF